MSDRIALLVEDDERVREVFAAYLETDGWTVEHAGDGLEALTSFAASRPHLIVTDIMMPRMDGATMLRLLRQDPANAEIPVLVVSGHANPGHELHGIPGPMTFLSKPTSLGGFMRAVRRLAPAAQSV